jgi:formiminoglutamase
MPLKSTTESLYFSKKDRAQDPRLGDFAQGAEISKLLHTNANDWALLGYPDDDGIALNGGRTGAALAPDIIRKHFYKMTPTQLPCPAFYDLGNLQPVQEIKDRHAEAKKYVQEVLSLKRTLFTLGGGHDYGYSDASGFMESVTTNKGEKPLVINFDAHLDVRSTDKGFHSGTPFFRFLQEYKSKMDFIEAGIQPQCNSPYHRKWAQDHGAIILSQHTLERLGIVQALQETIESVSGASTTSRPLWISLDMDAFCSKEAPGCSQSFATGLEVSSFLSALRYLKSNFSLRGMGIYEVSPPLDQDERTSKLAALIMHHTVFDAEET